MHPTFPGDACPIMIASRVNALDARNRAITFQHQIEPFIDEYSARCERRKSCLSPPSRSDVVDFHRRHRQLIASTLFLACANLSRHPLPCSVYPARLLRELVRDVAGRPVDTPSTNLLARVRAAAPHDWAAFAQSMHDLSLGPSHSSRWPALETAANTLRALDRLRPTWSRITAEREHHEYSWVRKDPAHRRAHGWLDLCTWLLSGLASTPDGPLRLFVDYLFGLLRHFDVCAGPSRAACDVLVLEVFAVVYSYADARGLDVVEPRLTLGSHGHDGCGLRKRVQRARLNSLLCGRPRARPLVSDELWLAWLRPRLTSLAGCVNGC